MKRLTDEQRELAAAHTHIAEIEASRMHRRYRTKDAVTRGDLLSDAMLGLCEAAARWDAAVGTPFRVFALRRVRGAIADGLRDSHGRGMGCGRGMLRRGDELGLVSLGELAGGMSMSLFGGVGDSDVIPDPAPPVGWEAEYEDEALAVARKQPPKAAAVLRTLLLDASCGTQAAAAARHGLSESRASQILAAAAETLRESR